MSRWLQQNETPNPQDESITGIFECETCYVYCFKALYMASQKMLAWTCPEGHVTTLKDVEID